MGRGRGNGQDGVQIGLRAAIFGTPEQKAALVEEYADLGTVIDDIDRIERSIMYLRDNQDALRDAGRDLILDLDDTLSVNNTLYVRSKTALGEYLERKCGGKTTAEYVERFDEIDEAMIPTWGFTPARWHESCRRLAEEAHGRIMTPGETAYTRRLSGIALGVGIPFPDTHEALKIARRAGLKIVLKTKGEEALQQEKIMAHDFSPFFSGIEIVQAKTPESMLRVAEEYGLRNPVMIGDSLNSDIKPAQGAGFGAVLMRYHHNVWEYESPESGGPVAPQAACLAEALLYIAQGKV